MRPPNRILNHDREEAAVREIGITIFSGKARLILLAGFLLTITGVPLSQSLFESASREGDHANSTSPEATPLRSAHEVDTPSPGGAQKMNLWERFVSLSASLKREFKECEKNLEDHSLLRVHVLPSIRTFAVSHLGLGNEKVYLGRDGWLYYSPDLDHVLSTKAVSAAPHLRGFISPRQAIRELKEELDKRGILLLVVPVPTKTMIAPQGLSSRSPMVRSAAWNEIFSGLASDGVAAVNLMPTLSQFRNTSKGHPLFLKTDTHWTPETMSQCAKAIASTAKGLLGEAGNSKRYEEESSISVTNKGDLAAMLALPKDSNLYPPEEAILHPVSQDSEPWKPDGHAEILLMGDSFSRIFSAKDLNWGANSGLPEHLSLSLGKPVDVLAINSGGANTCRRALARDPNRLDGKRLLIYEFSARDLTETNWERITLPDLSKSPSKGMTSDLSHVHLISGTIKQATKPPPPGSSPYSDVLISVHLSTTSDGKDCLVFLRGMKGGKLTAASQLSQGSSLSLHVRPWSDAEKEYGGINRIEPEGEAAGLPDIYWSDDLSEPIVK